jgi:methionine-rich copper-binding protein CopC
MNPLLRLLLVVIALLASPALAFGHAALTASFPSDGAMLSEAPRRVELRFSEAVTPLSVALALPDGAVQAIATVSDGTTLRSICRRPRRWALTWRSIVSFLKMAILSVAR